MKRIAIVGPESTGKSELAKQLADYFHCGWVPEVARHFLENLNRPYTQDDVEEIARLQLAEENKQIDLSPEILICDTTLLVIRIWMENSFGTCPGWILDSLSSRSYDLYLLMDIDLPWVPDPLREHPNQREFFRDWYIRELNKMGAKWKLISGVGQSRFQCAVNQIEKEWPRLTN